MNIALLIGFLAATALSVISNPVIGWTILQFSRRAKLDVAETKRILNLDLAAPVGNLERVIYIYAIMSTHIDIIGAWIVLKSFFFWVYKEGEEVGSRNAPQESQEQGEQMKIQQRSLELATSVQRFHIYIFGNGLSLIIGVFCGHIGNIVTRMLSQAW